MKKKYSKEDERIIKEMLETLYEHHSKLHGGSMAGGSFFTDFLHGFTVPFKQFGSALNFIKPGLGSVITAGANAIDNLVPGKRYDTIGDVFKGKAVAGSGRKRGRPRKVVAAA